MARCERDRDEREPRMGRGRERDHEPATLARMRCGATWWVWRAFGSGPAPAGLSGAIARFGQVTSCPPAPAR
jgi:hypothetical protein